MPALIGALRVSLSADTAAFHSGMKRAEVQARTSGAAIHKSLGLLKSAFAGLATGLSIGLITQGIKGALDYAGSLAEVSQQLGVTTKDLQVFRFAAGQVGVKQEQLETGLSKLTITLGKVAAGAKAPTAALNAIGISVDQLKGKDTGEAFRIIADGLEKVTDRSQRAAVEVALFGKSGAQLDNLLAGGSSAINELSLAAEKLGIVLSDEQIQKADETADKLEAVKTVLMARVAGTVADNASAIVQLADSLAYLIAQAGEAAAKMTAFYRTIAIQGARFVAGLPKPAQKLLFGTTGSAAILDAGARAIRGNIADRTPSKSSTARAPSGGADIGQFLAGGGGGAKKGKKDTSAADAERKRLEALRDAFQFEEEQRRVDKDILRAKQQLATDYVERTALSIQMLNLEQESFEADLQYRIAAGELTSAQADQLRAKQVVVDSLQRQAVLAEEEEQRQRDYNSLADKDFELKLERLELEADLTTTARERRVAELKILDLAHQEERNRLERIIRESKDWAEIEAARRELLELTKRQSLERQSTVQRTRGPLESHLSGLPGTADQMNEALENVAVNGLQSLEDGLVNIITGTQSVADAFKQMAASIIADLIRIQIQKMILNLVGSLSGVPGGGVIGGIGGGFATGGFTGNIGRNRIAGVVHGNEFVLNADATKRLGVPNLEALNRGAPAAAVSNDNIGGNSSFVFNNYAKMSEREARQTGAQAAVAYRQEMARANKAGL